MTSSRSTLRSSLVKVKQPRPDRKKKGVVYEVPCKDCSSVYNGETGRTLEKRISEHKTAVKKNDPKNGTAVHSWTNQHQVNWEATTVKQEEGSYWKKGPGGPAHPPATPNLKLGLWAQHQSILAPLVEQASIPLTPPPPPPRPLHSTSHPTLFV